MYRECFVGLGGGYDKHSWKVEITPDRGHIIFTRLSPNQVYLGDAVFDYRYIIAVRQINDDTFVYALGDKADPDTTSIDDIVIMTMRPGEPAVSTLVILHADGLHHLFVCMGKSAHAEESDCFIIGERTGHTDYCSVKYRCNIESYIRNELQSGPIPVYIMEVYNGLEIFVETLFVKATILAHHNMSVAECYDKLRKCYINNMFASGLEDVRAIIEKRRAEMERAEEYMSYISIGGKHFYQPEGTEYSDFLRSLWPEVKPLLLAGNGLEISDVKLPLLNFMNSFQYNQDEWDIEETSNGDSIVLRSLQESKDIYVYTVKDSVCEGLKQVGRATFLAAFRCEGKLDLRRFTVPELDKDTLRQASRYATWSDKVLDDLGTWLIRGGQEVKYYPYLRLNDSLCQLDDDKILAASGIYSISENKAYTDLTGLKNGPIMDQSEILMVRNTDGTAHPLTPDGMLDGRSFVVSMCRIGSGQCAAYGLVDVMTGKVVGKVYNLLSSGFEPAETQVDIWEIALRNRMEMHAAEQMAEMIAP